MATYGTKSLIPNMTSATAPSGLASVSSYHSTSGIHLAFDGSATVSSSSWVTNGVTTGWIQYSFGKEVLAGKYVIYPQSTFLVRAPKSWTLQASNDDGATWEILDTQVDVTGWANNVGKEFIIAPKPYKTFRLNITANSGDSQYLSINELQLFEYIPDRKFLIKNENGEIFTATFSDPNLNIVPKMTSDTTPSGKVIYNAYQGYPHYGWAAFDYSASTGWLGAVNQMSNQWIGYVFELPKIIGKYIIYPHPSDLEYTPKDFRFEASNDGVNWIVLDRKLGVTGWAIGQGKTFIIDNVNPYTHYRIYFESATAGNRYCGIGELQMYETYSTLFSLGVKNPTVEDFEKYGLKSGTILPLDAEFSTKKVYMVSSTDSVGSGRVFKKRINTLTTQIKKASKVG